MVILPKTGTQRATREARFAVTFPHPRASDSLTKIRRSRGHFFVGWHDRSPIPEGPPPAPLTQSSGNISTRWLREPPVRRRAEQRAASLQMPQPLPCAATFQDGFLSL